MVLGMHRSGTSAVARMLMLLGAEGPRHILPPNASNAAGHWEPEPIVELHDKLLATASSRWDDVNPIAPSWFESAAAEGFTERAAELMHAEYGDAALLVLKDPRMCRTVRLWLSALERYGAEPSFVLALRNPLEVAASLKARDRIVPGRGLLLWLRHTLEAELATRAHPRVLVGYEQLLGDWRSVARRVSERFSIAWPRMSPRAEVEIERFLSIQHRNHLVTEAELDARPEVVEWVKAAFAELNRAAGSGDAPDPDTLDAIRTRLDEADLAYGPVLAEAELAAEAGAADLGRVTGELDEAKRVAQEKNIALDRALAEVDQVRAGAADRERALRAEVAAHEMLVAERDRNLDRLRQTLASSEERGRREESARRELEGSRETTEAELRSAHALAETRAHELATARLDLDRQANSSQALADWTLHLEQSRSWRITAPMRRLLATLRGMLGKQAAQPDRPAISTAPAAPEADPGSAAVRQLGSAESNGTASGVSAQVQHFSAPGDQFEEFDPTIAAGAERRAKLVAFYLPQFHAIPENDRWWGKGFTEWRNVARGVPRFAGHHQPRIPRDLGYYDLSDPGVLRRQTELASQAGLHGFAFYYYSFSGRRLLEQPVEGFLADRSIDFPFCVVWANENWTRRWDGLDEEVLIRQDYDPAGDKPFVDDLQRHFDDPRYIRIGGRPLLLIYRFDIIPDAEETIARWRRLWENRHGERPLIFMVQAFEDDPRPYGADGAVEFPPQRLASWDNAINDELRFFDSSFHGHVLDYQRLADESRGAERPYRWIRGVTPSWDNDSRRQGGGTVLHGSTPERYGRWLESRVEEAERNPVDGESMVFVNAWNEWAEGAYLEPDVHYGSAYLNATARAVSGSKKPTARRKVLLVGHDAHPHGAQFNLRGLGATLTEQFGWEVTYLLLEGGELVADYGRQGATHVIDDPGRIPPLLEELRRGGYGLAITNTTAAGGVVPALKDSDFRVVSLIHELPGIIARMELEDDAARIAARADAVVFPATSVAEAFAGVAPVAEERVVIRPQGLYRDDLGASPADARRVREQLGIADDARIVLNLGFADRRKGIDTFVASARLAAERAPELEFVWVGNLAPEAKELREGRAGSGAERMHFVPHTEEVAPYLAAADVFFLSSREDPFPSVVLEALDAGLPVVGLSGASGCEQLIHEHGRLAPRDDIPAIVRALSESGSEQDPSAAEARRREVREHYRYDEWAFELLRLLDPALKKVSVAVPNYNYADQLAARLDSIFGQTHPLFEVLVLDDGSDDDSLVELERLRARCGRRFTVVANDRNSGSAIKQWGKACELTRGDYLWIAEADDLCRPEFAETLLRRFDESDLAFAFADSAQIDEHGAPLAESYKGYYRQSVGELMERDFLLDGESFVRKCLMERNLVLNVSSVIWRRSALAASIARSAEDLRDYELAGDWHLYAETALHGTKVGYVAEPLNVHRRHQGGVTGSLDKQRHLEEVRRVHDRMAEWLGENGSTRDRMRAYEQELTEQFGLGTNGAGHDEQEPPESVAGNNGFEISDEIRLLCGRYAAAHGVNPAVHEKDFILRFLLDHPSWEDLDGPVQYYFDDGRRSAERLTNVLDELGVRSRSNGSRMRLLEFASGYGCVTRHLGSVLPEAELIACDIHSEAVQFTQQELGADALLSRSVPEEFQPPHEFEVVFALSFFSHMPERTWRRWLLRLADCVADDGVLVFTTHGLQSKPHLGDPKIPKEGFWFQPDSEQHDLDTAEYGLTIVTPDYVRRALEGTDLELVKQESGLWWGHQDLNVVRRARGR